MLERMKEMIAEQLGVDAESVTEASSFKEDLGAVPGMRERYGENIFRIRKAVFFGDDWFSTEWL